MFQDIARITDCIKSIGQDPDIQIVRIKNRLDPAFDARQSGGYRNVAINLRIKTAQTIALGIDLHICSLQLLLQAMAEIKVYS